MENFYYYHAVKNSSCVLSFGDCTWWKLLISSEVYQQCHMKTIRTPNLSSKQERHKLMLKQLDLKKKAEEPFTQTLQSVKVTRLQPCAFNFKTL